MSELQTALVAICGNAFPVIALFVPLPEKLFFKCVCLMTETVSAVFCAVSLLCVFLPLPCDDVMHADASFFPALAVCNLILLLLICLRIFKLHFYKFLNNYSF
jgi:hypothetical protein